MFSRKDYINGNCSHGEYYSQFVTEEIKMLVTSQFGKKRIKEALKEGEHLTKIPLQEWDYLAGFISPDMRKQGDYLTLSGAVSILKEAARQVAKQ